MAILNEDLQKKWNPILNHPELAEIKDPYRKAVTAIVLENQQTAMDSDRSILSEAPVNVAGGISNFDPVLISLVRRALPNLIAYDVCGVQPMTGPTGLIFALRSRYNSQTGTEAFYNEANTVFSGNTATPATAAAAANTTPFDAGNNFAQSGALARALYDAGIGMPLGTGANQSENITPADMAISIEKVTVSALTRALKAEYSLEMAQDLKAIHGLEAETELSNILSTEILAEINREVIRTIYTVAKPGCQTGTVTSGIFDLDTDSNGRWSVERFKGMIFQIEREANAIAKQTRRGKGNILIVSSDVASALAMAGVLQYTPALKADLTVDDTGNTFAGMLHGKIKVYIDPYHGGTSAVSTELACVGYKGTSPYDSGIFYCPYIPLQMVRAVDPNTFQPKIGFKTRYGIVANPFAEGTTQGLGALTARSNVYYRIFGIRNLQ